MPINLYSQQPGCKKSLWAQTDCLTLKCMNMSCNCWFVQALWVHEEVSKVAAVATARGDALMGLMSSDPLTLLIRLLRPAFSNELFPHSVPNVCHMPASLSFRLSLSSVSKSSVSKENDQPAIILRLNYKFTSQTLQSGCCRLILT